MKLGFESNYVSFRNAISEGGVGTVDIELMFPFEMRFRKEEVGLVGIELMFPFEMRFRKEEVERWISNLCFLPK